MRGKMHADRRTANPDDGLGLGSYSNTGRVERTTRTNLMLVLVLLLGSMLPLCAQAPSSSHIECHVTMPNGIVAGSSERQDWSYGNALLSVGGLWPDGTIVFKPGGPGFATKDGRVGMKFGWTRGVRGTLKVSGRRLDAPAPPLAFETTTATATLDFRQVT
jgi:hypothetical protein